MRAEIEISDDICDAIVIEQMEQILSLDSGFFEGDDDLIKLAAATILNYFSVDE